MKIALADAVADRLSYGLLMLLAFMLPWTYHPYVLDSRMAVILHGAIALVFVSLFFFSQVNKRFFSSRVGNVAWVLAGGVVLSGLLVYALFGDDGMLGEVRNVVISLCALMVGWQMSMDEKKLKGLIVLFTLGIILVGLSIIFLQGDGFSITETYFADKKNSVGPMMATASMLCAGVALSASGKGKSLWIILGLSLSLFCMVLVLTVRARAALLALAVVLSLMFFQRYKSKYFFLSLAWMLLLVAALFLLMPDAVKHYVSQSLFSGFSGDITSGRMVRNQQAMQVMAENPLLGHLVNGRQPDTVHNYVLKVAFNYGLLTAAPLLFLYFYLLFVDLRAMVTRGVSTIYDVGHYALLIVFVVSMFEYSLPYGPGTTTVINFILFGIALRASVGESLCETKTEIVEINRI